MKRYLEYIRLNYSTNLYCLCEIELQFYAMDRYLAATMLRDSSGLCSLLTKTYLSQSEFKDFEYIFKYFILN